MLVGDPGYYERFGFRNRPEFALEGVPERNFMAQAFREDGIGGAVAFHDAFFAKG
jgi:putative acetyltransferase